MLNKETIIAELEVEDKDLYTYDSDRNIVTITHFSVEGKDFFIDDNHNSYSGSLCFDSIEELEDNKNIFWCWQKLTREV